MPSFAFPPTRLDVMQNLCDDNTFYGKQEGTPQPAVIGSASVYGHAHHFPCKCPVVKRELIFSVWRLPSRDSATVRHLSRFLFPRPGLRNWGRISERPAYPPPFPSWHSGSASFGIVRCCIVAKGSKESMLHIVAQRNCGAHDTC